MDRHTRPEPERAALLTVDVQNDFTRPGAPAEIAGTADAVPEMRRVVEAFRDAGRPVLHVLRLYEGDGSNAERCRRGTVAETPVVRPGTDGAELVAELRPDPDAAVDADRLLDGEFQSVGPSEWYAFKPRWSAFFDTGLADFLRERDVSTVVVCGCNFPNCPRATVYDATAHDFRVVFVPDATSGTYGRGLEELDGIGVAVRDAGAVADWVG